MDLTYETAIANVEHLIALGQTKIYLYRENSEGFPYDKVVRVEEGSSWRLGGPSSCRLIAEDRGLEFSLSVDFEPASANGRGVSMFDRDRLRDLMLKLPAVARSAFADMLERVVLPPLVTRTSEIRTAMRAQADSEDCLRGLIAFAREAAA